MFSEPPEGWSQERDAVAGQLGIQAEINPLPGRAHSSLATGNREPLHPPPIPQPHCAFQDGSPGSACLREMPGEVVTCPSYSGRAGEASQCPPSLPCRSCCPDLTYTAPHNRGPVPKVGTQPQRAPKACNSCSRTLSLR